MNYYVYKIININTGEFYIGKRQCKCNIKEDDYMGSGVKIKASISEQGEQNFIKKVLAICSDSDELAAVEGAFINYNNLDSLCLNIASGQTRIKTIYKEKFQYSERRLEDVERAYTDLFEKFRVLKRTHFRLLCEKEKLERVIQNKQL